MIAEVLEIAQKDLKDCLDNLYNNFGRSFTENHVMVYNALMRYTGDNSRWYDYGGNTQKILAAKNEQNNIVGIGMIPLNETEILAEINYLLSIEEGTGSAITQGMIDYSRQMPNRADISVLARSGSEGFYTKQGFTPVSQKGPRQFVRQKSSEYDPNVSIRRFRPLPSTEQKS